jgi:integral membrane sensor domain MASE1/anti-sigma regulatory factor (Ser/Thr protein kinase)
MGRRRLEGRWTSDVIKAIALGIVYYVAARLSLHLSLVEENVTPLWPPTGIAVAAFIVFGRRLWPGVAIAAFAVNVPISTSPLAAAVTAAGNTLAPIVAATLLRGVGFRAQIDRLRDALAIVFAALVSTLISASIGAATLLATDVILRRDLPGAWSVWWAGDAMGILVVAPFLLTLPALRVPAIGRRFAEVVALFAVLVAASFLAFTTGLPILFAVFPLLGWAAWRFQLQGVAPAALVVSLIATWAAVEERGPFAGTTLLDKMLTLQVFNAAVAFTSFFFAALVTERLRAREALERSAADLEERVRRRTGQLSATNQRLQDEVRERMEAEERLRSSERQLAQAQRIAQMGSWEWDLPSGIVTWSEEMYRIHAVETGDGPMTFERAIELVMPEDRARIRANIERAIGRGRATVPDAEYRIVRSDGGIRTLHGKARLILDDAGRPVRMLGSVQDVTERRELEREQRIAETLQRALLPQRLPELEGFAFASRYLPAEEGSTAGGDWYDVIELPDGLVALVIGDVAGHGVDAASVMGQVRMAVRAYSLEGREPEVVVRLVSSLLRSLYDAQQMVTMLYVLVDPATLELTVVNAGHPPPLVSVPGGAVSYLDLPVGLPVGLSWDLPYETSVVHLEEGSTLLLFTDGLVDRPDVSVPDGLDRLREAVAERVDADVDDLCGTLLELLVPPDAPDDVAILAARLVPVDQGRLSLRVPADPAKLATLRRTVGRWLARLELTAEETADLVLACSEACANAMEHAYGPGEGFVEVEAEAEGGEITMVVRDTGRWRPSRNPDRGRGLRMIEACVDSYAIIRSDSGTELHMRRAIRQGARR